MQETAQGTNGAAAAGEADGRQLLRWQRPQPGVLVLTLADAANRNTLSEEMLSALQAAIDEIAGDDATRCVVLAADGPAFCAGHNLKQMSARRSDADGGRAYYTQFMATCARMMQSIVASPKPFIAAVHAPAVAAGCQLVASCDMAVAATEARFGTTGINNGLFCSTPMVALSRKVGRAQAMELLMLGGLASADEARDMGLVNRVVPSGALLATAIEMAGIVASKSPAAIAMGKRAFYAQAELPLAEAYDVGSRALVENMMHCDAIEGIGAFIEKRKPVWEADR